MKYSERMIITAKIGNAEKQFTMVWGEYGEGCPAGSGSWVSEEFYYTVYRTGTKAHARHLVISGTDRTPEEYGNGLEKIEIEFPEVVNLKNSKYTSFGNHNSQEYPAGFDVPKGYELAN